MGVTQSGSGSTIAGRYSVGAILGRGGMGEVRAGRDLRLQRDVAIKVLSPEVAARADTRERFEAEARSAARLSHPNIVVVYDSGEHDGVPFLVMERLPGRTLADELAGGSIAAERARTLGVEVLAALGAAHAAGIVHRDVKPGNVLLTPEGTVKVGDFGIAKSVDGADLTTTGMLLGTPAYLSPEQLAGEPATPASDIYAVGVMLYEALTGAKPYTGPTPLALARAVDAGRPTPLRSLRPDTPADLAVAIERAMEKEPARRFATAEEMAAALTGTSPAPAFDGAVTGRIASTRAFGMATEHAAQREPTARLRALVDTRRLPTLAFIGIFAFAVILALVLTAGNDSPEPGAGATPTTAAGPSGAGPVPAQLDEALQRLEEVVRR